MISANIVHSFGQTILDSSKMVVPKVKLEIKDPEEDKIVEGFDGECEQCEIEKFKKPCTICEE